MTYLEAYRKCDSIEAIKEMAKRDAKFAVLLGGNPDRFRAIEEALNKAIEERGGE